MRPVFVLLPILALSAFVSVRFAAPASPAGTRASAAATGTSGAATGASAALQEPTVTRPRRPVVRIAPLVANASQQAGQAANRSRPHGFYFTRGMYGSGGYGSGPGWGRRGRGNSWATDYPKADLQFVTVLRRLLPTLDLSAEEHPVSFTDPELRRYPYLYAVEVSNLRLDTAEVRGLRDYLLAGGFLLVDDFWGTREWEQFEYQLRQVFPDRAIVELPLDHPIFHTVYEIDKVVQVPNVDNICYRGQTWEQDGYEPHVRAVLDDAGRVMVLISWNSDLGDAWEWAEQSCYPLEYSTYAFQLAVNTIVYAMSR